MGQVQSRVVLTAHTPKASEVIASAARLCYASNTRNLLDSNEAAANKFIQKLMSMGHLSPLEHASFTFLVEGVSRAMSHQLVRHRIASYSQRSQRYVNHDDFDYIIPPQFEGKTVIADDGSEISAEDYYTQTMNWLANRYDKLNSALGSAGESSNEDARYVLPNACETKIIITMNARSLLHFFAERLCLRAQWEIRQLAQQMLDQVKPVCPSIFASAGPKCVNQNHCPEGKLSCGQFAEIKNRYQNK